MIEWITLLLAGAAFVLAYQGIAYYKKDRARITEFFEKAAPVIDSLKAQVDDPDYIAVVAGKAMSHYLPHDQLFDMTRGVAQHVAEGSLPYMMDRIEASIPTLIAGAFSSDLARDLQSKSVTAKSIAGLGNGTKGPQALQFGLQKLLGGVNIPLDQVIAGYGALKEMQANKAPPKGDEMVAAGGVVIDYGHPSALEVGRA